MDEVQCSAECKSGNGRRHKCRQNESAGANNDQYAARMVEHPETKPRQRVVAFAVRTDEGGGRGVDDSAGQQVKVVLHRVHHHRVACVVAALQAHKQHTEEHKINSRPGRFVSHCRGRGQISVQVATSVVHHKRPGRTRSHGSGQRLYCKLEEMF